MDFVLEKRLGWLQEAFIHPCDGRLICMHALYLTNFGLLNKNPPPPPCITELERARTILKWISPKEESHIHPGRCICWILSRWRSYTWI